MKRPSKIISDSEEYLNLENNRELLYEFLNIFSWCEVYCRPVLKKYYKDEGKKIEDIGLCAKDICDAFAETGIYFDGENEKIIYKIFGAEDSPGKSSCRWLRNKVTHEMMGRAIHEICDRHDELIKNMKVFINTIENQS